MTSRKFCCSLGMKLLDLDTQEQIDCIPKAVLAAQPTWNGLWIDGQTSVNDATNDWWVWCNNSVPIPKSHSLWDTNYPVAVANVNAGLRVIVDKVTGKTVIQNIPSSITGPCICVGTTI
ncbi:hypothetical protein B566_EDAN018886, partial [Ephemera danica]